MATTILSNGVQFPDNSVQLSACSIKSVQTFFVNPKGSVSGGDFPNAVNVGISPVDPLKSFILYPNGIQTTTNLIFRTMTAKFLDSSTVQLACDDSGSVSFYDIRFQVVEFQ